MNPVGKRSYVDHIIDQGVQSIDSGSLVFFRIAFWRHDGGLGLGLSGIGKSDQAIRRASFSLYILLVRLDSSSPRNGMYYLFVGFILLAIAIAAGFFYRISSFLFAIGFTYFFLIERVNYQNHYYLISLISWWLPLLPLHRNVSIDAYRNPSLHSLTAPKWVLWVLRFHIGLPYFFGGIAKIHPDWMVGEPMRTMLAAKSNIPIIGPWLGGNRWCFASYGEACCLIF